MGHAERLTAMTYVLFTVDNSKPSICREIVIQIYAALISTKGFIQQQSSDDTSEGGGGPKEGGPKREPKAICYH